MRTLLLLLLFSAIQGGLCAEAAEGSFVAVRARILSPPKDFEFPGCRSEDHTIKPVKAHSSEIEIVLPKELKGKKLNFYHVPPLKKGSLWYLSGATVEFRIDQESLGSLYAKGDSRHSYKIPYSSNIRGDVRVIAEQ